MTNTTLNQANQQFWADLCGSALAKQVNATEVSPDGLRRYDSAYMEFYPYLIVHVPSSELYGKRVLEIGLGYGTLGTRIMESGADYMGVDISPGPLEMMRYRMESYGFHGELRQGDFLTMELPKNAFDAIIAIGSLHHTGSLRQSIKRVHSLLKPGGTDYIMVYNAFSYRHWISHPFKTLCHGVHEIVYSPKVSESDYLRKFYDADSKGNACPFTEFSSIRRIKQLFSQFSSITCTKENCADGKILGIKFAERDTLLPILGRKLGTDIYCRALK
ncbi:MAG: class I SAM-dependent methyltransferase [Desulfamplus sp.]|nr:class I SAM-dependent methyltransferase [Desulfamplus sp.]